MGGRGAAVLCWLLLLRALRGAAGECRTGGGGGCRVGVCSVSSSPPHGGGVPAGARPCSPKFFGRDAMVCVCSAAYCDAVEPVVLPGAGGFVTYESSKAGKRLQRTEGTFQRNAPTSGTATEPARLGKTSGIIGSNHRPLPPCPKTPNPNPSHHAQRPPITAHPTVPKHPQSHPSCHICS